MDLKTKYLGLELKNPIIVASSKLSGNIEKIAELEKNGAGAVVLKSIFEEQILLDTQRMVDNIDTSMHAEALDLFSGSTIGHFLDEYVNLIYQSKKEISIPVIPSINCTTEGTWTEYAKRFEKAGAPALELNIYIQPYDVKKTSQELEDTYVNILRKIKKEINIPVALKIGCYFTGLANVVKRFADEGANGLVLFNRYYRTDIDLEKMKVVTGPIMSSKEELFIPLQWIALFAGKVKTDISATTGVHSEKDVIKLLLAGATTVQLCSVLYQNGTGFIKDILDELETWMKKNNYNSIDDFRGLMSEEKSKDSYKRVQFIKTFTGVE